MRVMTHQGDRIREERERAGMTQPQLAKLVGVSARTIGNWERGEVGAPRNSLTRLRDALPGLREGAPDAPPAPEPADTLEHVVESLLARVDRLEKDRLANTSSKEKQ